MFTGLLALLLTYPVAAFVPVRAQAAVQATAVGSSQPDASLQAEGILARMEQRDRALETYQTRIHVSIHLQSFPWVSQHLDGTAYYKRPGSYEVVFDKAPAYAHGIDRVFGNAGDPAQWQRDSNIAYLGEQNIDGHPELLLKLTKKIYSDQLADSIAYVDPATYQVVRVDFHYRNGGVIEMTQQFKVQDGYDVLAAQHAQIHIPHVRAVADATFGTYALNVALRSAVFTGNH